MGLIDLQGPIRNALIQQFGASFFKPGLVKVNHARFDTVIKASGNRIRISADKALQQTAKEVGKQLVMRTPIRTGTARSGWIASIGSPDLSFKPSRVPYRRGNGPRGYGRTVINRNNAIISRAKNGDTVYLTNSVGYIAALEYGSSKQAPNGFVRLTLAEMSGYYKHAFKAAYLEGSVGAVAAGGPGGLIGPGGQIAF